jgi:alpha-mannosidase
MIHGFEFNNPLLVITDTPHKGDLPAEHSFLKVESDNLIVTVLKNAEDSDDMLLRFYETNGERCTSRIEVSEYLGIDAVYRTDLLENPLIGLNVEQNSFNVDVEAFSIESYKLIEDTF